nr:Mu transposase C-terminal domain-containing protein [uncultured Anaerosporobacter sp.]
MKQNDVIKNSEGIIFRVLELNDNKLFVVDCNKKRMPFWINVEEVADCEEYELSALDEVIEQDALAKMNQRFTMIAEILPVLSSENERNYTIAEVSGRFTVSKQTLRSYLWRYLVFQDKRALAPVVREASEKQLSKDEKNIRWSLNKFYYTSHKCSLQYAYRMMLKEKYCDTDGRLIESYPSFHQFRYFYRKTRKLENQYISRYGLKYYQRNLRPCVGESVQTFASAPGAAAMFDSTICNIFLLDESKTNIVGRPILTICVDGFSGMILGYYLSWEGGVYSLRELMCNIIADKVEHCNRYGIAVAKDEWPSQFPGCFVTDKGREYTSQTFSQLAELGVTIVDLPAYRPELKSSVERAFQGLDELMKPYLQGKGYIENDYQERGSKDYRAMASLNLIEFEAILLRCIIFYNNKRLMKDFPYTEQMIRDKVKPHPNDIWNWGFNNLPGCNLIEVDKSQLLLTLLPRAKGRFSRFGLTVNKLRYHNQAYKEMYLKGGEIVAAYNPEDITYVFVINKGNYVRFNLIDTRFEGKSLSCVEDLKKEQGLIMKEAEVEKLQAEIDLARNIQIITSRGNNDNRSIKDIRKNRQKETKRKHRDIIGEEL